MFREHPERYEAMRAKQAETMARYMNSLTHQQKLERREKMSALMKQLGHKPKMRGGNGTGPTKAESVLLKAFPAAINNYPIKTGMKAGSGYPTSYKADVAFPKWKLAVEADGTSHKMMDRKEQDAKKGKLLMGLGWTVLRFSNQRILEDSANVIQELKSIILRLKTIRPIP